MAPDHSGSLTDYIGGLSMTEIIRLQDQLSRELKRRFEKNLALGFSDVVGSTPYFERFGDEAGRKLQQRHFDLVQEVVSAANGRIVDTAGDGAFLVFPTTEAIAAGAFVDLQKKISADNASRSRDHQLEVRLGFHFGPVLTDGAHVTGEAVNLAARVAASGAPGEIRMTREAFRELSNVLYRLNSRSIGLLSLKGISREVDVLALEWRDRSLFPEGVRVKETGEEIQLPLTDTIAFGRLKDNEGFPANDIVLTLPNEVDTRKISRWHFELRRHADGIALRPVSDQITEVDGQPVAKGTEVPIKPGSVVRVGRAATLEFFSRPVVETVGTTDQGSFSP